MAKKPPVVVEEFRPTEIAAFKRSQWFETAKTIIQIFLMAILAVSLLVFLILVILAGVTVRFLPDTEAYGHFPNFFKK